VSARNSRAAKAARRTERHDRGEVAPGISRARIAGAVHQAVCAVTGGDGYGMCQLYARAGALTAEFVTGRPYTWQAGELLIGTGDVNEDGELHFQYKPAASGYNGLEFHCWIIARPDAPPGTTGEAGPDHEYADFGLRHMMRAIKLGGMPWRREPLPGWYWGTRAGLADLRVYPRTDPQMMALIGPRDTEMCLRTAAMAVRRLGIPPSQFGEWCERALRQAP
jgi:hypothetical protein